MTSNEADDLFKQLRQDFIKSLPARLAKLTDAFNQIDPKQAKPDDIQQLFHQAHSLIGVSGSYDMPRLSAKARELETAIRSIKDTNPNSESDWTVIAAMIEALYPLSTEEAHQTGEVLEPVSINRADTSPLIYLLEDDSHQSEATRLELIADGFRVQTFVNLASFSSALEQSAQADDIERPAAILMDLVIDNEQEDIFDIIRQIQKDPEHAIPVIILSVLSNIHSRLAAFRAGACRYITKPYNKSKLTEVLDSITGRQPKIPYRVVLVDDDQSLLLKEKAVLESVGMEVCAISKPLETMDIVDTFAPDVIVLDVHMPDVTGPELAAVLREKDSLLQTPILFLSSETDISNQLTALNLGGDDFLVKPIKPRHFISAVTARARRIRQNVAVQKRLEVTLYEREREHKALDQHALVSVTDIKGEILQVNDMLCQVSGYSRDELVGQNHRITKSGFQPAELYEDLWSTITCGNTWSGELCNRRKDGSLYWVQTSITPFVNDNGIPYQFVSISLDITKRKADEMALMESEEKYRLLLSNIPGMVYRGNPDWSVDYINNCELITGYSSEEMNQPEFNWLDLIHDDDRERVLDEVKGLITEEKALIQQYRVLHRSQQYRWVSDHKKSIFIEGEFQGVDGIVFDITERKEADFRIQKHKERLTRGQLYANIGTWEWDIVSGDLYWSERIAPLFGYTSGEVETSYENFLAAVHPDDRDAVVAAVNATIEDDQPYEIEHRVVWQDGTVRWLLERGAVARDEQGKPLQMLGVVQDIHDRKLAEEALEEQTEFLKLIFDNMPVMLFVKDQEFKIQQANDNFLNLYPEETRPHVIGTTTLENYSKDEVEEFLTEDKKAFETGFSEVEETILFPDGERRTLWTKKLRFHNKARQSFILGLSTDITTRKIAEQELIDAREEAERANMAKSDFLSNMSHELRTPMNAILGFSQLMKLDQSISPRQQKNVDEILRAGRHLLTLINEVLDLSKVESGNIDLSLEAVHINDVLKECLSLISPLAEKRSISVTIPDTEDLVLRADNTRLKQVILNLLSNAIKYNREKGSVIISLEPSKSKRIRINITDTGPGIPEDQMQNLFLPFNRLGAETTEIEGTGIGLTLTKRIIELMGGTVGAQSQVDHGSTFWIELPLDSAPVTSPPIETAMSDSSATESSSEDHQTVLYIEDNPANIRLVSGFMGLRNNVNLLTAHTPSLGIELAIDRLPDLILLDINLPGMDGYEVLKIVQAQPLLANTPVIAVTANAMPNDIAKGKAAGFNDYLTKPLDLHQFNETLDQYLKV